jgi:hypothetical protein
MSGDQLSWMISGVGREEAVKKMVVGFAHHGNGSAPVQGRSPWTDIKRFKFLRVARLCKKGAYGRGLGEPEAIFLEFDLLRCSGNINLFNHLNPDNIRKFPNFL